MSSWKLIKQLKEYRNEKILGGMSQDELETGRLALLSQLEAQNTNRPVYSISDRLDFVGHYFTFTVLRPVMFGLGVILLVAGGSLTSVSAAYDSLPGDILYPIKIASEQVRLTVTTSEVRRAELHVQFAGRRLDEMKAISTSAHSNKEERMKTAVQAFKDEVGEATTAMQAIVSSGTDASTVANALSTQAEEFENVIKSTGDELVDNTDNVVSEVESAQDDVAAAETAAVEVLVDSAETTPQSPAAEDLQKKFRKELASLDARMKLTLGRIQVVKNVMSADPNLKLTLNEWVSLDAIVSTLKGFDNDIHDAMAIMAAGGYRTAFERLGTIEDTLDRAEAEVVNVELSVIAQRAEVDEIVVDQVEQSCEEQCE